ncbi:MAG: cytochrome c3 family protein [Acidobacteriota bacterium]
MKILNKTYELIDETIRKSGKKISEKYWEEIPYRSSCLRCHQGIESQQGIIHGKNFSHRTHIINSKIECEKCHRRHEEKPKGEVLFISLNGCTKCHHQTVNRDCQVCHGELKTKEIKYESKLFSHQFHVEDTDLNCNNCHFLTKEKNFLLNKNKCSECH